MRSNVPADKTALFVLLNGGWRVLVAFVVVVLPMYGWILFYYLATGAWHQSVDLVSMNAPVLATLVVPVVAGAWVLGFRGWHLATSSVVAFIIAGSLPTDAIVSQLLPRGYAKLAIVLILLMIGLRVLHYWREYIMLALPIARYAYDACAVVAITIIGLLVLLAPIQL